MTQKKTPIDLHHMTRLQLLEFLLVVLEEKQELEEELRKTKEELTRREVILKNAGSIAEAVVGIDELFAKAQDTAKTYLDSIRALEERLAEEVEVREDARWRKEAERMDEKEIEEFFDDEEEEDEEDPIEAAEEEYGEENEEDVFLGIDAPLSSDCA